MTKQLLKYKNILINKYYHTAINYQNFGLYYLILKLSITGLVKTLLFMGFLFYFYMLLHIFREELAFIYSIF
jgi:hypothetical protein